MVDSSYMKQALLFILIFNIFELLGQNDSILKHLTKQFAETPNGSAFSIEIIEGRNVRHYGFLKKNDTLFNTNLSDSVFEIGSLTKVFTSTLLAHEIVQNNLDPNTTITEVFKFKFNNDLQPTYLELSNHTSGLYRLPSNMVEMLILHSQNPYAEYTYKHFNDYLESKIELEHQDGRYSYSNLGAGLLAYALSLKAQKDFATYLPTFLSQNFTMENTRFELPTSLPVHNADGKTVTAWDFNALKGAGGLRSTSSDLSKFVLAHLKKSNQTLRKTREVTHIKNDKISIGLGIHILKAKDQSPLYWHNGATAGSTSSLCFSVKHKKGIVILSNINTLNKIDLDNISLKILNSLIQ